MSTTFINLSIQVLHVCLTLAIWHVTSSVRYTSWQNEAQLNFPMVDSTRSIPMYFDVP